MSLIYEDGACTAHLVEDGATLGQIQVKPRKDAIALSDLPEGEASHLFFVASFAATAVFEGLGAHGTNILVSEGDDLSITVLPRFEGDGLDLSWDAERADPQSLESTASTLRDAFFSVGQEEESPTRASLADPAPETPSESVDPSRNYKLKQLRRGP